jgi:hypothetical protein
VEFPRKPTRATLPGCCPRAASGQLIAALLSSVMNSRRLTLWKYIPSPYEPQPQVDSTPSGPPKRPLRCDISTWLGTAVGQTLPFRAHLQ